MEEVWNVYRGWSETRGEIGGQGRGRRSASWTFVPFSVRRNVLLNERREKEYIHISQNWWLLRSAEPSHADGWRMPPTPDPTGPIKIDSPIPARPFLHEETIIKLRALLSPYCYEVWKLCDFSLAGELLQSIFWNLRVHSSDSGSVDWKKRAKLCWYLRDSHSPWL